MIAKKGRCDGCGEESNVLVVVMVRGEQMLYCPGCVANIAEFGDEGEDEE